MLQITKLIRGGSLTDVRLLALTILALCASVVHAQRVQGTYRPDSKTSVGWTINEHSTLVWDGKPYLPVGTIVDSPDAIEKASAAGISDYVVDLPASGAGWESIISSLTQHHSRFLLRVNSIAPMCPGVAVEPQGYRFTGIKGKETIRASMPGVQSALVVVALRRDGSISKFSREKVVDGVLEYNADSPGGLERVVLIYPLTTSAQLPDYWEALDKHRDSLLESLKRHSPGPGLRGIVDPFGRTLVLPGKELRFVPTSQYFRDEIREYLVDQYKSLETAERIWALASNNISSFDELARLVPLWSGTRGVSQMWDPETDRIFPCDNRRSKIWSDITTVVEAAGARRYSRIVSDLHQVVDVPVVQQWAGWASAYETPQPSLDGIGMRTSGTAPSVVFDTAGRATSSILRWKRPGWLPATEVELGPGAEPGQLAGVLEDVTSLGARGVFVRADTPAMLKAVATSGAAASDPSLAQSSPKAVYFPENAQNPAQIQLLPGGSWWLPSPMDGDRLDLGSLYSGYRYTSDGKKTFAIFAHKPGRVKLFMTQPRLAKITTLDGVDPKARIDKGTLELDMGTTPVIFTGIDDIPIPEGAIRETQSHFVQLGIILDKGHQEAPEELYTFQDAVSLFNQNPGAAFVKMQAAYHSLCLKMGRFVWVEAENTRDSNFSETDISPACSAGAALALRTQLPPGPDGYYATYTIPVRANADQDVWIAARIPADRRADVQVIVGGQEDPNGTTATVAGGQTLSINTEPVSLYGNGFGWYKLGVTRLAGSLSSIKVLVNGQTASDLALDVILLTPVPFVPDGVNLPDPVDFKALQKAQPKKKVRGGRSGGSQGS